MEDITIKRHENGCFEVLQGNRTSDHLGWDEMLGTIAALTMPETQPRPCTLWMKTKEQHEVERKLFTTKHNYK